jgi:hypothetical protein
MGTITSKIFSIVLIFIVALPMITNASQATTSGTFTVGLSVETATTSTTPTSTPTSTNGGGGGNGAPPSNPLPKILNVTVAPEIHSAVIKFETDPHAEATVAFGKTTDYEDGAIVESLYLKEHTAALTHLDPDTRYYFEISVTDGFGGTATYTGSFSTRAEGAVTVPTTPANPTTFVATPEANRVDLSWVVPGVSNPNVRIMRSETFYPSDPSDGEIVFEGKNTRAVDVNVTPGMTYYYTLFVKQGNQYSSGVIAKATVPAVGVEPLPPSTNPFENIPTSSTIDPRIQSLQISDFLFVQDGKVLSSENNRVTIDGTKDLTVLLPYDRVPEILKTIGITLHDPIDPNKTFSFLLRVNNDKSDYVATIAPLGRSGTYNLTIIILDYKNQGMKELTGALLAEAGSAVPLLSGVITHTSDLLDCPPFFLAVFLFLILAAALPRRRTLGQMLVSVR